MHLHGAIKDDSNATFHGGAYKAMTDSVRTLKVEVEEENVVQLAELAEEGALVMMIQMMIIMNHE